MAKTTKAAMLDAIDKNAEAFKDLSRFIGSNPALGNAEFLAAATADDVFASPDLLVRIREEFDRKEE